MKMNAKEAVYGLLGWLTSRKEVTTLSSKHFAFPAVDLAEAFLKANGLNDQKIRKCWAKNLIHPK